MPNIGGNKLTQGSDYFCIVEPNPLENKLPLHLTCSIHKQIWKKKTLQQMLALFRNTKHALVSLHRYFQCFVKGKRSDKLYTWMFIKKQSCKLLKYIIWTTCTFVFFLLFCSSFMVYISIFQIICFPDSLFGKIFNAGSK